MTEVIDTVEQSVETKTEKTPRFSFTADEIAVRDSYLIALMTDYMQSLIGIKIDATSRDGRGREVVHLSPSGPRVSLVESGEELMFHIDLQDDKHGGILIGPNKCNVMGLLNLVRMQQIRPHNKRIVLLYKFPSGKTEVFKDDHLFGKTKNIAADDFYIQNGIPAPHIKGRRPRPEKRQRDSMKELTKEGYVNDNAKPKSKQPATEAQIRKVLIEKLKYEMKVDTSIYNLETMSVEQLQEVVEMVRASSRAKLRSKT